MRTIWIVECIFDWSNKALHCLLIACISMRDFELQKVLICWKMMNAFERWCENELMQWHTHNENYYLHWMLVVSLIYNMHFWLGLEPDHKIRIYSFFLLLWVAKVAMGKYWTEKDKTRRNNKPIAWFSVSIMMTISSSSICICDWNLILVFVYCFIMIFYYRIDIPSSLKWLSMEPTPAK